jgi:hypothetical protein
MAKPIDPHTVGLEAQWKDAALKLESGITFVLTILPPDMDQFFAVLITQKLNEFAKTKSELLAKATT